MVWTTAAGQLNTSKKCKATFVLTELHDNRSLQFDIHVAKDMGAYDMIIGRDLMSDLGIDLQFSNNLIEWDGKTVPFKDAEATFEESFYIQEDVMELFNAREVPMDNDYHRANLREICESQSQLTKDQQQMLLKPYKPMKNYSMAHWVNGIWNLMISS